MEQAFPGVDNYEVASLRHYTLAKQEVAASVRAAKQLFQAHGAPEAAERWHALVVQLAGFLLARMLLPHLPQAIADGNIAGAVLLAGISLALGILTAACMAG